MRLNKRLVHWDTPEYRGGDWTDLITVNPRSIILFKSTCLLVYTLILVSEEWPHIVSESNLLLCYMNTCLCGQLTLFLVQLLSFDRKFGFAMCPRHTKMFVLLRFTSLEANKCFACQHMDVHSSNQAKYPKVFQTSISAEN